MRHSLFVITYCAFSSSGTFATDRVVSPSGLYNNISSAIAASSNGDRILVETGNYAENLDITKSISILPLVEGTRYTVNGSAYVAMAAGGRAVLSGARVMVGLWLSMAHTAHTEVVVVDSYLSSCSTVDPFVRTELYRDTIFANASISHGSIIGSYIRGDDNYGAFVLVQGPSSQPEEVLVIGNSIGVPTGGAGINLQTDAIFHVENNFVRTSPNVAPAVRINRVGALGGAPSTILNNTFYKLPDASVLESWTLQVPDGFRFVVKAPQLITHRKRLKNTEAELDQLLKAVAVLKDHRGPLLFQLPPNFKKDVALLQTLLRGVGRRVQAAVEFRHESWNDDDVSACLVAHKCARCVADTDEVPVTQLISTAPWGYLRLRRERYTTKQLKE